MSIAARCPQCHTNYRVKDELVGKRFVCKKCQSPVPVRATSVQVGPDLSRLLDDEDARPATDPAQETSTDLEMYGDTSEELVLKRTSYDADDAFAPHRHTGTASRSLTTRLAQNPLSLPGLAFLIWLPFSYLEPGFAWVVNIILGALCLGGAAVVKVLELLEVRFSNPLELLNQSVFSLFTTSSDTPAPNRKKVRLTGYDLALQLLIMLGCLALQTAVLSLKWYSLW